MGYRSHSRHTGSRKSQAGSIRHGASESFLDLVERCTEDLRSRQPSNVDRDDLALYRSAFAESSMLWGYRISPGVVYVGALALWSPDRASAGVGLLPGTQRKQAIRQCSKFSGG